MIVEYHVTLIKNLAESFNENFNKNFISFHFDFNYTQQAAENDTQQCHAEQF